jgi:hypothetical protein
VIPWEESVWGVDVDHGNGKHDLYPIGPQQTAEAEAERIRSGGRLRTRKELAKLLKRSGPI